MKKTLLIAAFAAPTLWAAHASAQACATDADCADGDACVFYDDCDCDYEADPWCCPGVCEPIGVGPIEDFECETDADCGEGWACERGADEICSTWACADGEDCPEPEVVCETWEYAYCMPDLIECSTDADCPDDLTCFTYEYEECSGGGSMGCAPGEDCPDVDFEEECTSVSESFCAPAYIGPCEADADCGEGFACVPEEVCWCGGSDAGGGSSGSGGGEVPPPLPDDPDAPDAGSGDDGGSGDEDTPDGGWDREPSEEDCGCEETGAFYCEPQEIICADDSECPDGWACESWGDSAVSCYEDESGEVICDEPETDDTMYCIPPEWGIWGAAGSGGYDDLAAEASGADEEGRSTGGLTPVNQNDDGSAGGGDSTDTTRPNAGGCSAAPGSGAGTGLLALLGLAATFRRRRS